MLRLFAKRGVRLASLPVVRQPPLHRTFLTGDHDVNGLPKFGAKENKEGSDNIKSNQQSRYGDENCLVRYPTRNSLPRSES